MSAARDNIFGAQLLPDKADVVIVGGGPGGLACALHLARAGAQVLVLERKPGFGRKVCAGGITCNGLVPLVPPDLIERAFPVQHVFSPRQRAQMVKKEPIIATINRERLGTWMAQQAADAGAMLHTGVHALALTVSGLLVRDSAGAVRSLHCSHVVGADGARSVIRRALGLPSRLSIGLNAMLPVLRQQMEWHLHPRLFASGYGWIFPHAETTSVGAFTDGSLISGKHLRQNLHIWAAAQGIELGGTSIQAGWVNYEYRGLCFGRRWLVGDAAGLSSALTGEGIYPAILSGQAVAAMILSGTTSPELEPLIKRHQRHRQLAQLAGRGRLVPALLAELFLVLLRLRAIDFHYLEMATSSTG